MDLKEVRAIVEATSLPMEKVPVTSGDALPGCKDADGVCQADFIWERTPESAQLYCGENGNALQINFAVYDEAGFKERVFISTSLQGG